MLDAAQIEKRIVDGSLKVSYSFLPVGDIFKQQPRPCMSDEEVAKDFFQQQLIRNRLGITVGPLIKVFRQFPVPKNVRFGKHKRIVDLRKCPEGFTLYPRERVLVMTNEHFSVSKDLAALVLSRVTAYMNGITCEASYIDSTWRGILKLAVTNESVEHIQIRLGDKVARVFFFDSPSDSEDYAKLSQASPHFDYSWSQILQDASDPFSDAGTGGAVSGFRLLLSKLAALVPQLDRVALVLAVVTFFGAALLTYFRLQDLERLESAVEQIRVASGALEATTAALARSAAVTGVQPLSVSPGSCDFTVALGPWGTRDTNPIILAYSEPTEGLSVLPRFSIDGNMEASLYFDCRADITEVYTVRWAVLP